MQFMLFSFYMLLITKHLANEHLSGRKGVGRNNSSSYCLMGCIETTFSDHETFWLLPNNQCCKAPLSLWVFFLFGSPVLKRIMKGKLTELDLLSGVRHGYLSLQFPLEPDGYTATMKWFILVSKCPRVCHDITPFQNPTYQVLLFFSHQDLLTFLIISGLQHFLSSVSWLQS